MSLVTIKHWNGNILYTTEADSIKAAVEALVKSEANLTGADLTGANLRGAIYGDGTPISKPPIYISGLTWNVMILDIHLQIGCELHSFTEWEAFTNQQISRMEERALPWWKQHKTAIFAVIKACR
jgi:hypothetical protein